MVRRIPLPGEGNRREDFVNFFIYRKQFKYFIDPEKQKNNKKVTTITVDSVAQANSKTDAFGRFSESGRYF